MSRLDKNDPYHMLFIEESDEQIERMERELLLLEAGEADEDAINIIFRMAHSLKGASSTLAIHEMSELSHQLESLLMKVRNHEMTLEGLTMEVALKAIDLLRGIHSGLLDPDAEPVEIEDISGRIAGLLRTSVGDMTEPVALPKATKESQAAVIFQEIPSGAVIVSVTFEADLILKSVKAYIVEKALSVLGTVLKVFPEDYEEIPDDDFGNMFLVALDTQQTAEAIEKQLNTITDLMSFSVEKNAQQTVERPFHNGAPEGPEIPARSSDGKRASTEEEKCSVRVSVHKINQLINLVGELIVDKEAMNKLSKDLKRRYKKDPAVIRLLDVYQHIDYLGSEMREIILSTRMLPLETIFNKFPRMVRDLAKKCEKRVNFVVEGKETGIDRGIIEELVDPLTHLLRNAVDHGIGSPEFRRSHGKPESGTITLSASQGENHVLITVGDDGGGIDPERIRRKAVEKGLLAAEAAEKMSREDIIQMVFEPGFSTAAEVSDVSGRGVGLDVVKSNIRRLNGTIEIFTEVGQGTRFVIKLPLTLAIIKAMLVREGRCTFAVPVSSIIEVMRLKGNEGWALIHSTAKNEVFSWREQMLPLLWLGECFQMPTNRQRDKLYIIIVGHGEKKTALAVEKIMGEQEIVIKSMGDFVGKGRLFGELRGNSGVSILGDGSFAQIIDVAAISRKERITESSDEQMKRVVKSDGSFDC